MKAEHIDRINFLAQKSRTPNGLTIEEKLEQAELRKQYIAAFRADLKGQLDNITIVDKDGNSRKLKKD